MSAQSSGKGMLYVDVASYYFYKLADMETGCDKHSGLTASQAGEDTPFHPCLRNVLLLTAHRQQKPSLQCLPLHLLPNLIPVQLPELPARPLLPADFHLPLT